MRYHGNEAMKIAQLNYDHQLPPGSEDPDPADFIRAQSEMLLTGFDADHIPFFSRGMDRGFADRADEIVHTIDDHEYPLLQMLLAVNNDNHELAKKLAQRFMPALVKLAEKLVETKINETPID
jgi:hypothetical protein